MAVPARAPNIREHRLIAGASRSIARSPPVPPPHIRFLYVAPQVSLPASFSELLTLLALRFTRVVAISSPEGLSPPKSSVMLGTQ